MLHVKVYVVVHRFLSSLLNALTFRQCKHLEG